MGSTAGMLVRLVFSLGLVLALMAGASSLLRRSGAGMGGTRRKGLPIEVVARHSVGRRSSVALVKAGGRGLVLGVTDHTITVLAETEPDDLLPFVPEQPAGTPVAPTSPWTALVDTVRERTVRR